MEAHGTRKLVTANDDVEVATSSGEQLAEATCESDAHRGQRLRIRVLDVVVEVSVIRETLVAGEIGEIAAIGGAGALGAKKTQPSCSTNPAESRSLSLAGRSIGCWRPW